MKKEILDIWTYWDNKTKKQVTINYTLQFVGEKLKRVFNFFTQPKTYLTEVKNTSEIFAYFEKKYSK